MTEFGENFIKLIKEGFECFFRYKGQVYFYNSFYTPDESDELDKSKWKNEIVLLTVEKKPEDDRYVWHDSEIGHVPMEKFINAKLFDGKSLMEIADDVEWANEYF